MSHPIYRLSSIARPLEPKYPTNLAVLILLPLIGIGMATWLVLGRDYALGEAALSGVSAMLAAFLTWALARELDPDRNQAAFVAMGLAVIAVGFELTPGLLITATVLMSVRIVNRTVGPSVRLTDLVMVLLLAGAAILISGAWWAGLILAAAISLDGYLDGDPKRNIVFSGMALALGLAGWGLQAFALPDFAPLWWEWMAAIVVVGGAFLAMALSCPPVKSHCDATGDALSRNRIKAGMILALTGGYLSLLGGLDGLTASLPIWAAMAGVTEGRAMPKRKL